jgi:carboxymethylenebutenolidase
VKEQAARLVAHGYVVLAMDLYRGKVTASRSEARKLRRRVPEDRAIRDMKAAFNSLAARPDVQSKHIGAIGWSMGGSFALQLAIHEPRLAACVVNYGTLTTDPVDIKIYSGASHAFENPNNKRGYRPEAAADAWSRTLKFYAQSKESKF